MSDQPKCGFMIQFGDVENIGKISRSVPSTSLCLSVCLCVCVFCMLSFRSFSYIHVKLKIIILFFLSDFETALILHANHWIVH